jgi:lysophospholipid acyltransferase (LPLAT)-like uncharacterized protein
MKSRFARPILWLEKYAGAAFLLLLKLTLRIKVREGQYPATPVIFVFWHRNLLPLLLQHTYQNAGVLISSSFDGELIAGPAQILGYQPVRGSSTRGGDQAFRGMLKLAKEHSLGITPDGPKGPAEIVKEGACFLGYLTGLPIIPIGVRISREWLFSSWDKFRVPKPFALVELYYGEAISIQQKTEIEQAGMQLQTALKKLPGSLLP